VTILLLTQLYACPAVSCDASDEVLRKQRAVLCNSLVQSHTQWCGDEWQNGTASKDWPNQAIYMQNLLSTLGSTTTCLNSTYARQTVGWINDSMGNASIAGNFMWTWLIFQVQYYDMPRLPGTRIESPDTLGRKCWAMAYLTQAWPRLITSLLPRLTDAGLAIPVFNSSYSEAMPLTMGLCQKVVCNCFVNASYDPSRSGHCQGAWDRFHYLGFDREGIKPGRLDVKFVWHQHC